MIDDDLVIFPFLTMSVSLNTSAQLSLLRRERRPNILVCDKSLTSL